MTGIHQYAPTQIPATEEEAKNLGQGGHWAHANTPSELAMIQNRAAATYHRARGELVPAFPEEGYANNIDWNNAIKGSRANTVELDLDDLRRQGVNLYATSNAEKP